MSRSRSAKTNKDLTAEKAAHVAKEAARNIREGAAAASETVKTFRENCQSSGLEERVKQESHVHQKYADE